MKRLGYLFLLLLVLMFAGCGGGGSDSGGITTDLSSGVGVGSGTVDASQAKIARVELTPLFADAKLEAYGARGLTSTTLSFGLMSIQVFDDSADPVAVANQDVDVITTLGSITVDKTIIDHTRSEMTVTTDAQGNAKFFLVAPPSLGKATVVVAAAGVFSKQVDVTFVAGPVKKVSVNFSGNKIAPEQTTLVTAKATDAIDSPVSGAVLNFSVSTANSTGAKLDKSMVTTDANGLATVTYTAGTMTAASVVDTVTAAFDANAYNSATIEVSKSETQVQSVTLDGYFGGTLEAYGARIGTNYSLSTGTMFVTVVGNNGNLANQEVEVQTTLGSITTSTQPTVDHARNVVTLTTDANGSAQFKLIAPSSLGVGSVIVSAAGKFSDPVTVEYIRGPVQVIKPEFSVSTIAPGTAAEVTALATDNLGFPVPSTLLVFSMTPQSTGARIDRT
ncbi:MAG: hypothetical protein RQ724_07725, partial [Desulfuromonadales bacterium]|nr:hypothetical protein [Desulfuromonadales bacterium]